MRDHYIEVANIIRSYQLSIIELIRELNQVLFWIILESEALTDLPWNKVTRLR